MRKTMSYYVLKHMKLDTKTKRVFLTGGDNNIYPRHNTTFECDSLSKLWQEKGRDALDAAFMDEYTMGLIQQGTNKYAKAKKYFDTLGSHHKDAWEERRNDIDKTEYHKLLLQILRESEEITKKKGDFVIVLHNTQAHYPTSYFVSRGNYRIRYTDKVSMCRHYKNLLDAHYRAIYLSHFKPEVVNLNAV